MDFASKQVRQLAADGKTKSGTAVFAAGARIGLLKCLEDQLLLFDGNTDAGVGYLERDHRGGVVQDRMLGAPASHGRRHVQPDAALGRKFERVRQQVFQHLLKPLRIGDEAPRQVGIEIDVERQLAIFGFVPERPSNRFEQA